MRETAAASPRASESQADPPDGNCAASRRGRAETRRQASRAGRRSRRKGQKAGKQIRITHQAIMEVQSGVRFPGIPTAPTKSPAAREPQRRFSRELQILAGAASINRCAFGLYDEVNSCRRDTVHSEFELSPALSSSVLIRLIRLDACSRGCLRKHCGIDPSQVHQGTPRMRYAGPRIQMIRALWSPSTTRKSPAYAGLVDWRVKR